MRKHFANPGPWAAFALATVALIVFAGSPGAGQAPVQVSRRTEAHLQDHDQDLAGPDAWRPGDRDRREENSGLVAHLRQEA